MRSICSNNLKLACTLKNVVSQHFENLLRNFTSTQTVLAPSPPHHEHYEAQNTGSMVIHTSQNATQTETCDKKTEITSEKNNLPAEMLPQILT